MGCSMGTRRTHRRLMYDGLYINMLTMLVSSLSVGSLAQRKAPPFFPFCQLSLFYLWEKAIIFSLVSSLLYVINFEDTDSIKQARVLFDSILSLKKIQIT